MEYYSAIKRNTFESVLMRWMNLEPIIQSEVSQKEKDKYHILTHIYGIFFPFFISFLHSSLPLFFFNKKSLEKKTMIKLRTPLTLA